MGIDTNTPTGQLMAGVMGAVAQFEREMMLERQREGIKKAHGEGKYRGRAPTAAVKAAEVLALHAQGIGPSLIAKQLRIGRTSVYRIIDGSVVKPDLKHWRSLVARATSLEGS